MLSISGDGYCRSEGIVAIYLQKHKDAKRIYSTIVHSKTNSDGNKEQGKYKCLAAVIYQIGFPFEVLKRIIVLVNDVVINKAM